MDPAPLSGKAARSFGCTACQARVYRADRELAARASQAAGAGLFVTRSAARQSMAQRNRSAAAVARASGRAPQSLQEALGAAGSAGLATARVACRMSGAQVQRNGAF